MDTTHTYHSHSARETQDVARAVAATLKPGTLICLYGELGSGKTTFIQGLAESLGVTQRIISPTFMLAREYDLPSSGTLYHIDVYKTDSTDSTFSISEMIADPKGIVLVEWADRIQETLPEKRIDIFFQMNDDESRSIQIINTTI